MNVATTIVRTVGKGFSPLDQQLRINRHGWSEQVDKQVVKLIAHNSYGDAIETYAELVGLPAENNSLGKNRERTTIATHVLTHQKHAWIG